MENKPETSKTVSKVLEFLLPTVLIIALVLILKIASANPDVHPSTEIPHEELLTMLVGYVVLGCELAAALVVAVSAVKGIVAYLRKAFTSSLSKQICSSETIRVDIGTKLVLALEFAMAADVLRLAIAPTFADIIVLFSIILLRVLLNYFLDHDIQTIREGHMVPELNILDTGHDDEED